MKRVILAAVLALASSVAFADVTSVLLDGKKIRSMSAEEFISAVRSAPDVNVRGKFRATPLHVAAVLGTPDNIIALVGAGADLNARDNYGWTPLHAAAGAGTPANITSLINAGAGVETRSDIGFTPLHVAAAIGTPDNITTLLDAGASGGAKDEDGMTPFGRAGDNEKVKETAAYEALNDAQYK